MLRRIALVLAVASLWLPFTGCSKSITVKAAIVYKMGGAQPIARAPFYLLDDSLDNILSNAGFKAESSDGSVTFAFEYGMAATYHSESEQFKKMQAAIQPHIVKTASTDFDGTAKFDRVKAGIYYIVGVAETRGGFAVWNLKVEAGESVILDQNNAADIS